MAFKLRSNPLKSGFKTMGSSSPMESHNIAHYRFPKTRKDFGRGWKGKAAWKDYQASMWNEANKNKATDRKYHANKGNAEYTLSDRQKSLNKKWMEKYNHPAYKTHIGPNGQVFLEKYEIDSKTNKPVPIKEGLQPVAGSTRGYNNVERDYMKHYDMNNPDADWEKAANIERENIANQKALEKQWKDDARTKYNQEGGSRLYASDDAMKNYPGYAGDIPEGSSRIYFSGEDDLWKLQTLASNPKLTDDQRTSVTNMMSQLRAGRPVVLNFSDSDIQSNWREYRDPMNPDAEPRKIMTGKDSGSYKFGFGKSVSGDTDADLTRALVNLVSTGNRLPEDTSASMNENQEKIKKTIDENKGGSSEIINNTGDGSSQGDDDNDGVSNIKDPSSDKDPNVIDNNLNPNETIDTNNSGIVASPGGFQEAFKNARSGEGYDGVPQATFEWNGKLFHSRQANETPEEWAAKFGTDLDAVPGARKGPQPTTPGEEHLMSVPGRDDIRINTNTGEVVKTGSTTPDGDKENLMNVPDRDDIKINTDTGEVVKVDQPKTQDKNVVNKQNVNVKDDDPVVFNEEDELDIEATPEEEEEVDILPSKEETDAYGSSGEPQTVDPPSYEPQSSQDDDDDDDDDS